MNIKCECGKRMAVSDALAGKSVRCPQCGATIFVAPAAPGTAVKKQEAPSVYISPAMIVGGVTLAVLLIGGLLIYFGPMRVSRQWDDMDMKARATVMNIIVYTQKAYLSEKGEFDPLVRPPAIERDGVSFSKPYFSFSMPKKVRFDGHSTSGPFTGYYNTQTGEVEADVEAGANVIGGMVVVKNASATLHITAHEENNNPIVMSEGRQLKIIPVSLPDGVRR